MAAGTRWLVAIVVLAGVTLACDEPHGRPGDYHALRDVVSPSGDHRAILIRQHNRGRGHDPWFVAVWDAGRSTDSASLATVRATTSALYATNADRLMLSWSSDSDLVIACDSCGMQAVDVLISHGRAGGVRVSFHGFPATDAFGAPIPRP